MIFADKLVQLRKKAGWSQEELAEQMNVTRQSVSKWEGAQAIPDFEKLVRLSQLFGVSTDYLLKDDIEEAETTLSFEESSGLRHVSMEEANAFLSIKNSTSNTIALASFIGILSPACLIILGAMSNQPEYGIAENVGLGIGLIVLLLLVALAAALFISAGRKTEDYDYLEKESFDTQYGVSEMVKKHKAEYDGTYTRNNIIGTTLGIISTIPILVGALFNEQNEVFMASMLALTLVLISIGSVFFIKSGIIWSSFNALLQEGEYTKENKDSQAITNSISSIYWILVIVIFLGYSFITKNWKFSWIIIVVAGLLYPVLEQIIKLVRNRKR